MTPELEAYLRSRAAFDRWFDRMAEHFFIHGDPQYFEWLERDREWLFQHWQGRALALSEGAEWIRH